MIPGKEAPARNLSNAMNDRAVIQPSNPFLAIPAKSGGGPRFYLGLSNTLYEAPIRRAVAASMRKFATLILALTVI